MASANKSVRLAPEVKELLDTFEGTHSEVIQKALEALQNETPVDTSSDSLTSFLNDSEPVEFFSNVDGEKKEKLEQGLSKEGLTPTMTYNQLLELSSSLTGMSAETILKEALSYMGQKLIGQALSNYGSQGSLGAADQRIIQAIDDLRHDITEGLYKPRQKKGQDRMLLSLARIAGKAGTNVITVSNCLKRRPDLLDQMDVTDLID